MSHPSIIAIDGPAASGKSTLAWELAESLGYLYFDTGVMYRAATLAVLKQELDEKDETKVSELAPELLIDVRPPSVEDGRQYDVYLDGGDVTWDLRSPEVEAKVSLISTYPSVRAAMTARQREIGLRGDVVMVGRDIGTVVLPEADLKIYLDASVEERATRRYKECIARGEDVAYDEILASMKERDLIDSTRDLAPLKAAEDAIVLDNTGKSVEVVVQQVLELINSRSKF